MNFFSKNRFIAWLLVFLVVVNISALISFFVLFANPSAESRQNMCEPARNRPGMAIQKALGLSPQQTMQVDAILACTKSSTDPVIAEIKNKRGEVLEELSKDAPDTLFIHKNTRDICELQKKLQETSVNEYLALRKVCNPGQCQKLSSLFYELYGCPVMGMGKGMKRDRCGKDPQGCGKMDSTR